MPSSRPFDVRVHPFPSETRASCAYEYGPNDAPNALVYIGGLSDGPHSSPMCRYLAEGLASSGLDFGAWDFRMRSSYAGFGFSSLANDAADTAAVVTYLRKLGKNKIVLVGHSTGCQGCLEYTNRSKYDAPGVDGYVLIAPVSDREFAAMALPKEVLDATIEVARKMIEEGRAEDAMPKEVVPPVFSTPVTAYRWHSLAAQGGDDDYFSADLDDSTLSQTFGRIDKPVMILSSEKDEMVPPTVDKKALVRRWLDMCAAGIGSAESGIIPGADHGLSDDKAKEWLAERVFRFLRSLS